MNNICKQYIKQLKMLFPIMGKSEKIYIRNLASDLEDFCEEENIRSIDELYSKFGNPVDTMNNFFSSLDTTKVLKRIITSKWIKRITIFLLVIITCSCITIGIYQCKKLLIYEKEAAAFTEITIK